MAIRNELVSQFVKITNDKTEQKQETTVFGTVRSQGGETYVQLDGSDLFTPVKMTVDAAPGERVLVLIKDHKAIVNGDTSVVAARESQVAAINHHIGAVIGADESIQSSRLDIVDSDIQAIGADVLIQNSNIEAIDAKVELQNASIEAIDTKVELQDSSIEAIDTKVNLQNSQIQSIGSAISLQQSNIEAIDTRVQMQNTNIGTLDSKVNIINSVFTIKDGQITGIKGIDAQFANFDAATIGTATIQELFAQHGIIKDVVVQDQKITGELVGVTIHGDLIDANTVVADKLVILGEDGLYYKLNTNGMSITAQQTDYNSLNGSIITAKSITADRIDVSDLVAFAATIGGFRIVADALYTPSKQSVMSTARGVYLGSDGQFSVGDGTSYIRYYKDTVTNTYKLDIQANDLSFTGLDSISNAISCIQTGTDDQGLRYVEFSAFGDQFKIQISNQQIQFLEGNQIAAWIGSQTLHINRAEIQNELYFGQFMWAQHGPTGYKSMGLMWKGDS